MNCNRLREVELGGIQKIEPSAFESCSSLQRITLPSTIIEIGNYAFQSCFNLREVGLHESIETIGRFAFKGCSALERFTFPSISTRLNNIMQSGNYPIIEAKIDEVRGVVERRGSVLFVLAAAMNRGRNWDTIKASLDQIVCWIRYHEIKEATTLFELALWKAKINQEEHPINREACRIEVPGPVKDVILQYL